MTIRVCLYKRKSSFLLLSLLYSSTWQTAASCTSYSYVNKHGKMFQRQHQGGECFKTLGIESYYTKVQVIVIYTSFRFLKCPEC